LRLKALVRAITISRTKAVVNLPSRVDEVHYLDFTLDERQVYDDVKNETVKCLQDAISSDSRNGTGFNALQRLNSLRMISSHGLLAQSYRKKKDANHTQASPLSFRTQILNSLNEEISIGCAICSQCGIEILDGSLEYSPIPNFGGPAFNAKYDDILCGLCTLMGLDVSSPFPWPSSGRLDASAVSICRSPSPALQVGADMLSMDSMPTKVNALATDLSVHCPTEKRLVTNQLKIAASRHMFGFLTCTVLCSPTGHIHLTWYRQCLKIGGCCIPVLMERCLLPNEQIHCGRSKLTNHCA
jgi:SWI/SNF-related matrix-associated actin-dependent regulator of chromatin subfamily A3